jgi:broad specificity phosphatase PhoE
MVILHFVRHAQGVHNLSHSNEQFRDPELTELGQQQCQTLQARFPHHDKIAHVIASPMRRTLYTALLSFPGHRVTALPTLQEISKLPCDVGSPKEKLVAEFGDKVDFSLVTDDWYLKGKNSPFAPDISKLEARGKAARAWLRDFVSRLEPGAHIALVSHGGFLHFLTGDWEGIKPSNGEFESQDHRHR